MATRDGAGGDAGEERAGGEGVGGEGVGGEGAGEDEGGIVRKLRRGARARPCRR